MSSTTIYSSPLCSCIVCKKEYSSKGIHSHYRISHTTEGKIKHLTNSKAGNITSSITKKKIYENKKIVEIDKYNKNPNFCLQCNSILNFDIRNNKFCSRSCSGTSNNIQRANSGWALTSDSKLRISAGVIKTVTEKNKKLLENNEECQINLSSGAIYTPIYPCHNCHKFFFRPSSSGKQNCSEECTHEIRSRKARNNPGLGTRRSKQEKELFLLCQQEFIGVEANTKIVDGWDADIILRHKKVAILWNGPWHYKEMNFGNHSLTQVQNRDRIKIKLFLENGWNVEIFEDRHYSPTTAINVLKLKYKMV